MKKILACMALPLCLAVSACGGGDDGGSSAGPAIKLSYSGVPMVRAQQAKAMASTNAAVGASAGSSVTAADAQATIDALSQAFKARGADIGVYPGVIDGTALHQLVMAENGGIPPTGDELDRATTDISEWALVNFQLDDMSGYIDTPAREAAVAQFARDLAIYTAREYMKGRVVFAALPIVSCAPSKTIPVTDSSGSSSVKTVHTASHELDYAIASKAKYETTVSGPNGVARWDVRLFQTIGGARPTAEHMGGDCNTPDKETRDAYIAAIADPLVERYKIALDTIDKCKHNPEAIPEYERAGQCWGIVPEKK
ncbi:hypothetical protein [Burkholderia pseudomallei]|uniref:hypothetical protein n=1 Tax=Burkholderia pseudomallei TaxID=28450 RepID=UPI0022D21D82|nr:hypothetical protein [Burkholderia pseudomallei]MDA0560310.1 hypothetical protein [Burkholderia pseudomallei]